MTVSVVFVVDWCWLLLLSIGAECSRVVVVNLCQFVSVVVVVSYCQCGLVSLLIGVGCCRCQLLVALCSRIVLY